MRDERKEKEPELLLLEDGCDACPLKSYGGTGTALGLLS